MNPFESPDHGLRIAALSIRPDRSQRCTLCEGPFPTVDNGWAQVESLYVGTEQLGIACAHCVLVLRKTEQTQ